MVEDHLQKTFNISMDEYSQIRLNKFMDIFDSKNNQLYAATLFGMLAAYIVSGWFTDTNPMDERLKNHFHD
jgi:hypothetical protein